VSSGREREFCRYLDCGILADGFACATTCNAAPRALSAVLHILLRVIEAQAGAKKLTGAAKNSLVKKREEGAAAAK